MILTFGEPHYVLGGLLASSPNTLLLRSRSRPKKEHLYKFNFANCCIVGVPPYSISRARLTHRSGKLGFHRTTEERLQHHISHRLMRSCIENIAARGNFWRRIATSIFPVAPAR